MHCSLPAILTDLSAFAAAQGVQLWLVGGSVRDLLRGRVPVDFDLALAGDGFALARAYADATDAAFVPLDATRATGRIVTRSDPPLTLDLAALRGPSIEADLRCRDFTINALALPLGASAGELIDPTGGQADLMAGMLRPCSSTSLLDDPVRVLRAARFCAHLGLRPADELAPLMHAAAPRLATVAPERCRDELLRLLDAPYAAPWLRYLDACGALTLLIPELEAARNCEQPRIHFLPVLAHSLETVAALDWLIGQMRGEPLPAELIPCTIVDCRLQIAEHGVPMDVSVLDNAACSRVIGITALPVALQHNPNLSGTIPYAAMLVSLLNETRGGGSYRRSALLKFAALLHDNAKPQCKAQQPDGSVNFHGHQSQGAEVALQICRRLRISRNESGYVRLIVREHMRPGQLRNAEVVSARAIARFFRDLEPAAPDVLLHELADHLATRGPTLNPQAWTTHVAWIEQVLHAGYSPAPEQPKPLVNGHDLMDILSLSPGPQLGALLREIGEAQAAGEITTRAEALALARAKLHG
ncbi:CCA tRNA nucleotidyltransferase [Candidatus Viridilinea mediisalina]|uniref:Polynucleotide adenylyltransferase n=1 Tax=Candidatus Viridilinea mediisalina TaxID=2024553 RepID=A0A2A6RFH5_9CHLR|nr:HD domain-containing protein [Candidatus Viridilinea mediisalina]PDW01772.1 polynucleotide adenylyltransferase [Candidatus Viridilinea mediisalina]